MNVVKYLFIALIVVPVMSLHAEPLVSEAWIRLLPPTVTTTAAYAEITVSESDEVIAISSDIVDRIEMHETSMHEGMMNMRPIPSLTLMENEPLILEPNGKHLMLIGLKRALQGGEKVMLDFQFKNAGVVPIIFEVRKP